MRLITLVALACAGAVRAQDAPIDDAALVRKIEARCEALRTEGKLVRLDALHAEAPPERVELPLISPRVKDLAPAALCALLRQSALLIGTYHHCEECGGWHFDAASGVPLSSDGVAATCWHVLEPDPDVAETYAVAAALDGRAWPVRAVLAANRERDLCIVATGAEGLTPMPLRCGVRQGERVWCLSHPDHRFGFFAEGLIARWFVDREPPEEGSDAPLPPGHEAYEVTLDFAQGSSGAPIVDAAGNVVALAQATQTIVAPAEHEDDTDDVQMVVKIAAPAAALRALITAPR